MRLPLAQLAVLWCCMSLAACSSANGMSALPPGPADDEVGGDGEEAGEESEGEAGGGHSGVGGSGSQGGATSSGGEAGQGGSGGAPSSTGGASGEPPAAGGGTSTPCSYPASGYGTAEGDVIDPATSWTGYAPGATGASTLGVASFLDCDGKGGRNALLIIHSTSWCTSCQQEAAELEEKLNQSWAAAGVVVVEVLVENPNGDPATTQTAKSWKDYFGIESAWVAADPGFLLASPVADSYPYEVLVDPRTMKIVKTLAGGSMDDSVMQLAKQNAD